MNKFAAVGLGAAAVVLAFVVGTRLLGPPATSGVGGAPSTAPSATPSAAPSVTPSAAPTISTSGFIPVGRYAIVDAGAPKGPVRTTVTIPGSGWTSDPAFAAIGKGEDGDPPEATMLAWSWLAGTRFDVFTDPCKWASTRPDKPATTVDGLAAALAAQASRDASDPVDVTIGGYAGKHVTLHVPTDADFNKCDEGNFASYGETGQSGPSRWHQGPGQVDELWILDVNGKFMIIDAMYRPNTPAAYIDEMRAIAESATFE